MIKRVLFSALVLLTAFNSKATPYMFDTAPAISTDDARMEPYERGKRYWLEDKNDSALVWLDKAVTHPADTADYPRVVEALLLRSQVLSSLTFFERAMSDAMQSFDISKKHGGEDSRAAALLGIGKVHYLMYNDSVAEKYMLQAREVAEAHGLEAELMQAKNGLAQLYSVLERNDECLALARESLDMAIEQQDTLYIIQNLNLFASYYINLNRWTDPIVEEYQQEAKRYLDQAMQLALLKNIPRLIINTNMHLIRYWRVARDYTKALEIANWLIELCDPTQFSILIQVYDHLVGIYAHLGDTRMVINSHQQFHVLMRQQSDYHLHQSLQDMKVRYETAEKEAEISRQTLVISRQKTVHAILFLVLGLSVALLVLLGYFLRLRGKRARELAEMNATKNLFFSIISHDLKSPALSLRDALQLLADEGGSWNNERLKHYHGVLLKSANHQLELLYNLLDWAQVQTGRMPYNPVPFDLVGELHSILSLTRDMAARKGIAFRAVQPEAAVITGDSRMLSTVVRNLLTNAVKFTGRGGEIVFEIKPAEGDKYMVSVSDTGIGMNKQQVKELFRVDRLHTRTGTSGEQSSGLGLIVSNELLAKHGCRLQVQSEEGSGSRFRFSM